MKYYILTAVLALVLGQVDGLSGALGAEPDYQTNLPSAVSSEDTAATEAPEVRTPGSATPLGLSAFLARLISVDHMPRPVNGKLAMVSTWDRTGGNGDGTDFKHVEGDRNVLLDVDGPGCVHRIFTGMLGKHVAGTQIRVFLDGSPTATFDMPVDKFFDDKNGPIPYPLVFHKTYPGTLFPIPFAKHCRIELFSAAEKKNWGNYWQLTYMRYAKGTPVETLRWPLSAAEQKVLQDVCRAWLRAESAPPETPERWTLEKTISLAPGASHEVSLADSGVIRQLRVHATEKGSELFSDHQAKNAGAAVPQTSSDPFSVPFSVLGGVKMRIFWDGEATASVDMPIGYFFGNVATGYKDRYYSLLLGTDGGYSYCRFPMPFRKGAVLQFENGSPAAVKLDVAIDVGSVGADAGELGRFRATLNTTEVEEELANRERLPRFGKMNVPVHQVLDLTGKRGKYVGVFLHIDWPLESWWGEGDWLIWTDEEGWPPAYHGTGSEEYFNSGWCLFDRKAVSGIIREPKMRPGHIGVYSFHLNDCFPFTKNIRVAEEIMPWAYFTPEKLPHAFWRSTAYWYELP